MNGVQSHMPNLPSSTTGNKIVAVPSAEHVQHSNQQIQQSLATIKDFPDFVTGNYQNQIPVAGTTFALEALGQSIRSGCHVQQSIPDHGFRQYQPLEQALAAACIPLNLESMSAYALYQMHLSQDPTAYIPHGLQVTQQYLTKIEQAFTCKGVTIEVMMALIDLFSLRHCLPELGMKLGIVVCGQKRMPMAYLYPSSHSNNNLSSPTAWIIVVRGPETIYYSGIGGVPVQSPLGLSLRIPGMPASTESALLNTPSTASSRSSRKRKFGTRSTSSRSSRTATPATPTPKEPRGPSEMTKLLRTPLPAGIPPHEIIDKYAAQLTYNTILKAALHYSNNRIAHACSKSDRKTVAASATVKRIGTACVWIEEVFGITKDAFRVHFERQRSMAGITTRQQVKVDQEIIDQNIEKISAALGWIRRGGPLRQEEVDMFKIKRKYLFEGIRPVGSHVHAQHNSALLGSEESFNDLFARNDSATTSPSGSYSHPSDATGSQTVTDGTQPPYNTSTSTIQTPGYPDIPTNPAYDYSFNHINDFTPTDNDPTHDFMSNISEPTPMYEVSAPFHGNYNVPDLSFSRIMADLTDYTTANNIS